MVLGAARLGLLFMLFWAPLPIGSNRPLFWAVNAFLASAILALFLLGKAWRRPSRQDSPLTAWLVGGLLTIVSWMLLQASWVPFDSLAHPIRSDLGSDLPGSYGAISANPAASMTMVAQFAPPAMLAIVAAYLCASRTHAAVLLKMIILSTTALAAYGLSAQYLGFGQSILTDTDAYPGSLTSTFVGRNSAATYLAIGLVSACAMLGESVNPAVGSGSRSASSLEPFLAVFSGSGIYLVAIAVILSALLNTGSRAGVAAGLAGALCVAIISVRPLTPGRWVRLAVLMFSVAMLAVVAMASSTFLFERFATADVAEEARFNVYRDTIRLIAERPFLGHGAGTFSDVYPLFQSASVPAFSVWNRAHNTYLQLAAELGLPMTAALYAVAAVALYQTARGLAHRDEPAPLSVAAVGAFIVVGLHSLADFSLQIQAVGILFAVIAGAGYGESCRLLSERRGARSDISDSGEAPRRQSKLQTTYLDIPKALKASSCSSPIDHAARVPDGWRIYAFGDVHGRRDLLERLYLAIGADLERSRPAKCVVVGLGDYIDRGPDSRGAVELLIHGLVADTELVCLRGNHEELLLRFIEEPNRHAGQWFELGGLECLRSYGVDRHLLAAPKPDPLLLRAELIKRIPVSHLELLRATVISYTAGDYFFAHAGARPGTPLCRQDPQDLLWIRRDQTIADAPTEKIVVHGHSPIDQPYFGRFHINIDTGAYASNRLTCIALESTTCRLIEN